MQAPPVIADVGKRGNESSPLDVAQAGKLRSVELQRRCQNAHLVQPVLANLGVLHVDVENAVRKLVERLHVVDLLPHQVGRVELSPKLFDGISVNIRLQMAGEMAMFFPPGHSSFVKSMGQFSIAIFTPWLSAMLTTSGQTEANFAKVLVQVFADRGQ